MPINFSPTRLAIATVALSSFAHAEDARITCTGTVATVVNGGLATPSFSSAAVGDAVTFTFDVEIDPTPDLLEVSHVVNWPTCKATIGSATEALVRSSEPTLAQFQFWNGDSSQDLFIFQGGLSSSPETFVQVSLFDSTGLALSSGEFRDLLGTSLSISAWGTTRFRMEDAQGSLEFSLSSVDIDPAPGGVQGTPYCTAVPNSTGSIATLTAYGLATPGDNDLTLIAEGLPTSRFGYFLVSSTQGFTPAAGGSQGNLCLSGSIGRFKDQVQRSDDGGRIILPLELDSLPGPTGAIAVQSGQTWNFQLWNRDFSQATGATSNFSQALAVTFQ